jgi:hypothetical protein
VFFVHIAFLSTEKTSKFEVFGLKRPHDKNNSRVSKLLILLTLHHWSEGESNPRPQHCEIGFKKNCQSQLSA